MDKHIKLIKDLSNANGASRFELPVVEAARKHISTELITSVDRMNNLKIIRKDGNENKPRIILDGHSDELGLMVQSITSRGLLRVNNIGGWEAKNLLAQKFRMTNIKGELIKGIVATIPVHYLTDKMRSHTTQISDILVDVGVNSREEAKELGIYIGMTMVPDVDFEFFDRNGGIMMGKAFDNRLGCALVIDVMNSDYRSSKYELHGYLSSQEEVGSRGANVIAKRYSERDVAIIFEGVPSDDGHVDLEEAQAICGGGVQIRLKDNGMISDPGIARLAIELAEKNDIDYQLLVRAGGSTNGRIYEQYGIPSLVLSVPVRFAHSSYCISNLNDYMEALKLAKLFIEYIDKNGLVKNSLH